MNHVSFINVYLAGFVKRHHVNPSEAVQNVAHHSWGVAVILDYIWPQAPKHVLLAALRHDVAERWTGDTPAYVKWRHPDIAGALAAVEANVENLLGYDGDLTEQEAQALKVADLLELMLYCYHRRQMGDRYFGDVLENVRQWFSDHEKIMAPFPLADALYTQITRFDFTANP